MSPPVDSGRAARRAIREATRTARALGGGRLPGARHGGRGWKSFRVLALLALALVLLPPFTWPVLAPTSSGFFWRFAPKALLPFSLEFHDGLDLAVPLGTRVRPAAPGIVAATGSDAVSGRWVRLRHLGGFESFYAHLERLDTSPGRLILLPGFSSLGRSGSSGRSTGPHLHFELRFLGRSLPPGILLAPHRLRLLLLGF